MASLASFYGAVGRAVASDPSDPQFESSQPQFYLNSTVLNKLNTKDRRKQRNIEAGNGRMYYYVL